MKLALSLPQLPEVQMKHSQPIMRAPPSNLNIIHSLYSSRQKTKKATQKKKEKQHNVRKMNEIIIPPFKDRAGLVYLAVMSYTFIFHSQFFVPL